MFSNVSLSSSFSSNVAELLARINLKVRPCGGGWVKVSLPGDQNPSLAVNVQNGGWHDHRTQATSKDQGAGARALLAYISQHWGINPDQLFNGSVDPARIQEILNAGGKAGKGTPNLAINLWLCGYGYRMPLPVRPVTQHFQKVEWDRIWLPVQDQWDTVDEYFKSRNVDPSCFINAGIAKVADLNHQAKPDSMDGQMLALGADFILMFGMFPFGKSPKAKHTKITGVQRYYFKYGDGKYQPPQLLGRKMLGQVGFTQVQSLGQQQRSKRFVDGDAFYVGEGLESTLTPAQTTRFRSLVCWDAGNLKKLAEHVPNVRQTCACGEPSEVMVLVDDDNGPHYTGQRSSKFLVNALIAKGHIAHYLIPPKWPEVPRSADKNARDWNDVGMQQPERVREALVEAATFSEEMLALVKDNDAQQAHRESVNQTASLVAEAIARVQLSWNQALPLGNKLLTDAAMALYGTKDKTHASVQTARKGYAKLIKHLRQHCSRGSIKSLLNLRDAPRLKITRINGVDYAILIQPIRDPVSDTLIAISPAMMVPIQGEGIGALQETREFSLRDGQERAYGYAMVRKDRAIASRILNVSTSFLTSLVLMEHVKGDHLTLFDQNGLEHIHAEPLIQQGCRTFRFWCDRNRSDGTLVAAKAGAQYLFVAARSAGVEIEVQYLMTPTRYRKEGANFQDVPPDQRAKAVRESMDAAETEKSKDQSDCPPDDVEDYTYTDLENVPGKMADLLDDIIMHPGAGKKVIIKSVTGAGKSHALADVLARAKMSPVALSVAALMHNRHGRDALIGAVLSRFTELGITGNPAIRTAPGRVTLVPPETFDEMRKHGFKVENYTQIDDAQAERIGITLGSECGDPGKAKKKFLHCQEYFPHMKQLSPELQQKVTDGEMDELTAWYLSNPGVQQAGFGASFTGTDGKVNPAVTDITGHGSQHHCLHDCGHGVFTAWMMGVRRGKDDDGNLPEWIQPEHHAGCAHQFMQWSALAADIIAITTQKLECDPRFEKADDRNRGSIIEDEQGMLVTPTIISRKELNYLIHASNAVFKKFERKCKKKEITIQEEFDHHAILRTCIDVINNLTNGVLSNAMARSELGDRALPTSEWWHDDKPLPDISCAGITPKIAIECIDKLLDGGRITPFEQWWSAYDDRKVFPKVIIKIMRDAIENNVLMLVPGNPHASNYTAKQNHLIAYTKTHTGELLDSKRSKINCCILDATPTRNTMDIGARAGATCHELNVRPRHPHTIRLMRGNAFTKTGMRSRADSLLDQMHQQVEAAILRGKNPRIITSKDTAGQYNKRYGERKYKQVMHSLTGKMEDIPIFDAHHWGVAERGQNVFFEERVDVIFVFGLDRPPLSVIIGQYEAERILYGLDRIPWDKNVQMVEKEITYQTLKGLVTQTYLLPDNLDCEHFYREFFSVRLIQADGRLRVIRANYPCEFIMFIEVPPLVEANFQITDVEQLETHNQKTHDERTMIAVDVVNHLKDQGVDPSYNQVSDGMAKVTAKHDGCNQNVWKVALRISELSYDTRVIDNSNPVVTTMDARLLECIEPEVAQRDMHQLRRALYLAHYQHGGPIADAPAYRLCQDYFAGQAIDHDAITPDLQAVHEELLEHAPGSFEVDDALLRTAFGLLLTDDPGLRRHPLLHAIWYGKFLSDDPSNDPAHSVSSGGDTHSQNTSSPDG
jgi:hypothetical protein